LGETDQAQQCPKPCSKKNGICVAGLINFIHQHIFKYLFILGECLCKFPYVGETCDKSINIK